MDNATKLELCNRVSKKLGNMPVNDIKRTVEVFLDEVIKVLAEGQRIEIRGFGSFTVKLRKARTGRNPRTGVTVPIPEYKAPIFKFSGAAQTIFNRSVPKEPKT